MRFVFAALLVVSFVDPASAQQAPRFELDSRPGRLEIVVEGRPVAAYIFADSTITRPYYAHVRSLSGVQLTRSHPPVAGRDRTDHADMHPGIWLAFGDIGGADVWRNKARAVHQKFVDGPKVNGASGSFTALNHYQDGQRLICRETARHRFDWIEEGLLLSLESAFTSENEFYFGDQEEMGLGVRLATGLTVGDGGRILDSEGRRNEKAIWGSSAAWCDYGREEAGILIMTHPENAAPARWHVRDYGLMVANPFAVKAFNQGAARRTVVKGGERWRMRFGILLRDKQSDPERLKAVYERYLALEKMSR